MPSNATDPEALAGATGSGGSICLAAVDTRENSKPFAAEAARFSTREQVYEAAERASHFLACLMAHIAADDQPGIAYCYRKFAAHGRVVAAGCKDLISSEERL